MQVNPNIIRDIFCQRPGQSPRGGPARPGQNIASRPPWMPGDRDHFNIDTGTIVMDGCKRRKFLALLTFSGITFLVLSRLDLAAGSPTNYSEDQAVPFRWRVPVAHFDAVNNNLQFRGDVTLETDTKGAPLVFIFVGLVLLPQLADAVLALRREIIHGGVVIDTRGKEIMIKNDPRLDGGVIVVVSKEGTKIYERDELGNPTELIKALTTAR